MIIDDGAVGFLSLATTPETRISEVSGPMVGACLAYQRLCKLYNVTGAMTGASRERVYLREPLHWHGKAWDFRSYVFPDPQEALKAFEQFLLDTDPCYRVVYIKPPKPAHFHVEYRG